MKTTSSNEDDGLRDLLKSWRVEAAPPPRFQEQVWRRIARGEEKAARPLSVWLLELASLGAELLRRPVGAVAYVSVLVALGMLAGVWRSDDYASRTEAAWRTAYLQAVTPMLPLASRP